MAMTVKAAGSKRWKGISAKERKKIAAKGGRSAWANMSLDERSAEMKRRAKVREEPEESEMKSPADPNVMTTAEVAEYLHVHRITVYRLIDRALLHPFKVGSVLRFKRSDLIALTKQRGPVESPVKPSAKKRKKRK